MGNDHLQNLCDLSKAFGTTEHVIGNGGNSSMKTADVLWVKASGKKMGTPTETTFVGLARSRIGPLLDLPTSRDRLDQQIFQRQYDAVLPGSVGRPSVETLLHEAIPFTYVIHSHPPIVNALTCAQQGEEACRQLLPQAVWLDFCDPGHTLAIRIKEAMQKHGSRHREVPRAFLFQNHGIALGGNTLSEVKETWESMRESLLAFYRESDMAVTLTITQPRDPGKSASNCATVEEFLLSNGEEMCVILSGPFAVAEGPITPDHIVYGKPYPFLGVPSNSGLDGFRKEHGYSPRIYASDNEVVTTGKLHSDAALTMEIAKDGALVRKLSSLFGGLRFMDHETATLIDGWDVEAYRRKMAEEK